MDLPPPVAFDEGEELLPPPPDLPPPPPAAAAALPPPPPPAAAAAPPPPAPAARTRAAPPPAAAAAENADDLFANLDEVLGGLEDDFGADFGLAGAAADGGGDDPLDMGDDPFFGGSARSRRTAVNDDPFGQKAAAAAGNRKTATATATATDTAAAAPKRAGPKRALPKVPGPPVVAATALLPPAAALPPPPATFATAPAPAAGAGALPPPPAGLPPPPDLPPPVLEADMPPPPLPVAGGALPPPLPAGGSSFPTPPPVPAPRTGSTHSSSPQRGPAPKVPAPRAAAAGGGGGGGGGGKAEEESAASPAPPPPPVEVGPDATEAEYKAYMIAKYEWETAYPAAAAALNAQKKKREGGAAAAGAAGGGGGEQSALIFVSSPTGDSEIQTRAPLSQSVLEFRALVCEMMSADVTSSTLHLYVAGCLLEPSRTLADYRLHAGGCRLMLRDTKPGQLTEAIVASYKDGMTPAGGFDHHAKRVFKDARLTRDDVGKDTDLAYNVLKAWFEETQAHTPRDKRARAATGVFVPDGTHPLKLLTNPKKRPKECEGWKLEAYLSDEEFKQAFTMTKKEFHAIPFHKKWALKKRAKLHL